MTSNNASPMGITATELFACNPFRILGISVDSTQSDISAQYKKLTEMSDRGTLADFKTMYDMDFLPPFSRSSESLKTAYAKLASIGYRCFAYSDSIFSQSLNTDDIALNLQSISDYDCFLRCYMWLIMNDREFDEPELWIPLCKYIDRMIMSSPEQWDRYFDHRFPADTADKTTAYRSFYTTFCDIILLPLKEMVRGSMKCHSSIEILKCANVDVNEVFPYIEIPQANKAKDGQPEPKLKIAVKEGEEYYDVSSGKMVTSDAEAKIESNMFTAADTMFSADAIIGDGEESDEDIIPDEPTEADIPMPTYAPPAPVENTTTENEAVADEAVPEKKEPAVEISAPPARHKIVIPSQKKVESESNAPQFSDEIPKPFVTPTPAVDVSQQTVQTSEKAKPAADFKPYTPPAAPKAVDFSTDSSESVSIPETSSVSTEAAPKARKPFKRANKGLTDYVDEAEKHVADNLDESVETEENYADELIRMLRSNRNGSMMRSADMSKSFNNGDNLGSPEKSSLVMDEINLKKMNEKLLDSDYDKMKELTPRQILEEKYKNANMNEMSNGMMNKYAKGYTPSAIDEYQKKKQQQKGMLSTVLKVLGIFLIVLAIYIILFLSGIL